MDEERTARINRLKWHCRRSMLELDLVFEHFWADHGDTLDTQGEEALTRLLELEDHELWALVSGRKVSDDPRLTGIIALLRVI